MRPDGRNTFLVAYDISDPKRLNRVARLLCGRGWRIQRSIFLCRLNARNLVELRAELNEVIDSRNDQVLFVDLGPSDGRGAAAISSIGCVVDEETKPRGATII
jgi:CRISPR-associated protein Cas2